MPVISVSKATDFLTYAFAVGLAATCIAFAGYKVVVLGTIENPPADMGLNFPTAKRKVTSDDTILVDQMPTNSISGPADATIRSNRILQPYTSDAPIRDYRLLTVIDDVAFVEVLTLKGRKILPMSVGTWLPGSGPVDAIAFTDGRWTLTAGEVKLVAEKR